MSISLLAYFHYTTIFGLVPPLLEIFPTTLYVCGSSYLAAPRAQRLTGRKWPPRGGSCETNPWLLLLLLLLYPSYNKICRFLTVLMSISLLAHFHYTTISGVVPPLLLYPPVFGPLSLLYPSCAFFPQHFMFVGLLTLQPR